MAFYNNAVPFGTQIERYSWYIAVQIITVYCSIKNMQILRFFFLVLLIPAQPTKGWSLKSFQSYNIVDFGAAMNDTSFNSKVAIQGAIDACANAGGGRVTVPRGVFMTGSLRLKSRVELHLEAGAVILGSLKHGDYDRNIWSALILAKGARGVSITGSGTIDGRGLAVARAIDSLVKAGLLTDSYRNNRPDEINRPQLIDFVECEDVRIEGVILRNSSCWVQTYTHCRKLRIEGIRVESTAYWNNDGMDIVDCQWVRVTGCRLNVSDDGICLKSGDATSKCKDVVIKDCVVRSSASALKFGTFSYGGFVQVKVRNLEVYDTYRSAIALECVDGGSIDGVDIRHVRVRHSGNAIFIKLGRRNTKVAEGVIRNILISDVEADIPNVKPDKGYPMEGPVDKEAYNLLPSSIMGLPGHSIEKVRLEDIVIHYGGGSRKEIAYMPIDSLSKVPERPADYPEFSMLGELPAWGFYFRHVSGVKCNRVRIDCLGHDYRPGFVADDVKDLSISNSVIGSQDSPSDMVLWHVEVVKPIKLTNKSVGIRRKANSVLILPD